MKKATHAKHANGSLWFASRAQRPQIIQAAAICVHPRIILYLRLNRLAMLPIDGCPGGDLQRRGEVAEASGQAGRQAV
jgi:hypothetical protein